MPDSVVPLLGRGIENAIRHVELESLMTEARELIDVAGVQRRVGAAHSSTFARDIAYSRSLRL